MPAASHSLYLHIEGIGRDGGLGESPAELAVLPGLDGDLTPAVSHTEVGGIVPRLH